MKTKLFIAAVVCICLVFAISSLGFAYGSSWDPKSVSKTTGVSDSGTISCVIPAKAVVDFDCFDNHTSTVDFERIAQHTIKADVDNGSFEFDVWSNVPLFGHLDAGQLALDHHSDVKLATKYAEAGINNWADAGNGLFPKSLGKGWNDRFFDFKPVIADNATPDYGTYYATVTYTVYAQY